MESLLDQLTSNPIILAVAVVLALLVVFSFVKRLIRLALFMVAILILYLAYLVWTGQEIPTSPQELKETIEEGYKRGKEVVTKKFDSVGNELKEKVEEEAKKAIKDKLE